MPWNEDALRHSRNWNRMESCPECGGRYVAGRGMGRHRWAIHGVGRPALVSKAPSLSRTQQHANRIRLLHREGYSTSAIARIVSMDVTQVRSLLTGDRTSPEWVPIGRTG